MCHQRSAVRGARVVVDGGGERVDDLVVELCPGTATQLGANGVTLAVTPRSCPANNFDAYVADDGNWSTAANWSQGAPPSRTQVACWAAGTTVTVSDTESADSIQAGGDFSIISGGTLKRTSASHASSVSALALKVGGELDGPTSPDYISAGKASRGVLRVRGGTIQETGIPSVACTDTRGAQRRLLSAFNSA